MHRDPKALNAACYAFFDACRDGGARATADEPSLIRNLNVSLALKPAITAYLSASLPADAAELVERLQEFAKSTVLPVEADNGERLDHTDSLPWLAASLILSQAARIAALEAVAWRDFVALRIKALEDGPRSAKKDFAIEELAFVLKHAPCARPAEQAVTEAVTETVSEIDRQRAYDWFNDNFNGLPDVKSLVDGVLTAALAQEKGR